jgi:transcriptional regulator with XRE-family HTH domain
MERGIRASENGLENAKVELRLKGYTQEYLAGLAGCTRQTIIKFLAGANVNMTIFQNICVALGLNWKNIAELEDVWKYGEYKIFRQVCVA